MIYSEDDKRFRAFLRHSIPQSYSPRLKWPQLTTFIRSHFDFIAQTLCTGQQTGHNLWNLELDRNLPADAYPTLTFFKIDEILKSSLDNEVGEKSHGWERLKRFAQYAKEHPTDSALYYRDRGIVFSPTDLQNSDIDGAIDRSLELNGLKKTFCCFVISTPNEKRVVREDPLFKKILHISSEKCWSFSFRDDVSDIGKCKTKCLTSDFKSPLSSDYQYYYGRGKITCGALVDWDDEKDMPTEANVNEDCLGYFVLQDADRSKGSAHLHALHVNPNNSKSGIGTLILHFLINTLSVEGDPVTSLTLVAPKDVEEFYKKQGFELVSRDLESGMCNLEWKAEFHPLNEEQKMRLAMWVLNINPAKIF